MAKASWPAYGSNFSKGTTDAIGILVEMFNDCELALGYILLSFMKGKIWHNHLVVEQMGSTAVIDAIQGYLAESPHRKKLEEAVIFSIRSFEVCRANRNSIIHFGMAWRKERGYVTKLMRVKLRAGRQRLMRTIKPGDVRTVADSCHALKIYMDNLSVSIDDVLKRKPFKEPQRPPSPKALSWVKEPY
jgi:hypothetical protein